jgi:hypothetical protein
MYVRNNNTLKAQQDPMATEYPHCTALVAVAVDSSSARTTTPVADVAYKAAAVSVFCVARIPIVSGFSFFAAVAA